jgi:hypothetical protein
MDKLPDSAAPQSDTAPAPLPRRKAWLAASFAGTFGAALISLSLAIAVVLGDDPAVLTIPASELPAFDETSLTLEAGPRADAGDKLAELHIPSGSSRKNIIVVDGARQTRAVEIRTEEGSRVVARPGQRALE